MARPGFMVTFAFFSRFSEASDRAIGAWMRMHSYSAEVGDGGRIRDCKSWGGARWLRKLSVDGKSIHEAIDAGLMVWDGNDLVLADYDHKGDDYFRKQAETGRLGGLAKASAAMKNELAALEEKPSGASPGPSGATKNVSEKASPHALPCLAMPCHAKQVEGETREEPPPPVPSRVGGKVVVRTLLAEHGLPAGPQECAEWKGGLSKIARIGSLDEAQVFLRWAVDVCRRDGVIVEYWRQVRTLAIEWDAGQRANHWQPIREATGA